MIHAAIDTNPMPEFYKEFWGMVLHGKKSKPSFQHFHVDEVYARDSRYFTRVEVPATLVIKDGYGGSLWDVYCFKPELCEWIAHNVNGILFYDAREYIRNPERYVMMFYFEQEREAILFKTFWA
jgi:hypothetical protein